MAVTTEIDVEILGPLTVTVEGAAVHLGGPKPRGVLALLLLERGRIVPSETLVERLWGEPAGDRPAATLQVHVSNLRKALAPLSDALGGTEVIVTRGSGYAVELPDGAVDLARFDRLVSDAREAAGGGEVARAADLFAAAAQLRKGEPLADLRDELWWDDAVRPLVRRLDAATVEGMSLGLDAGRHAELLPVLEQMVQADPLDEGLRGMLMLALYRSGRQAAALSAYQEGRDALVEQLGVDPGPALRELERRILDQDPTLDPASRPAADLEFTTALRSSLLMGAAELEVGDRRLTLDRAVTTIGRRASQDVVVDDARASRAHAAIRSHGGRHVVEDLGSTNGTQLNGAPLVAPQVLADGDVIRIGDTELVFRTIG